MLESNEISIILGIIKSHGGEQCLFFFFFPSFFCGDREEQGSICFLIPHLGSTIGSCLLCFLHNQGCQISSCCVSSDPCVRSNRGLQASAEMGSTGCRNTGSFTFNISTDCRPESGRVLFAVTGFHTLPWRSFASGIIAVV